MKELKKLLITFDYELFLGRHSGSVDNCIIKPTNSILKVLNRYGVKALFFVDTIYILRLRQKALEFAAAKADYDKIMAQLQTLVRDGHYLFPHIHAHWRNAIYVRALNTWQLNDLSKYRFHDLDEAARSEAFHDSMELLKEIILPLKPDYVIDCYRAGGWCLQPFSTFKPYFEKYHITGDFSVTPGIKSVSDRNYHDYTNAKRHIYSFKDDVLKDESGPFTEFPVSVMHPGMFAKFMCKVETKILWYLRMKNSGDGNSAQFSPKPFTKYAHQVLSIDTMLLSKAANYRAFVKENGYIHFVSHPKMLSHYNIKLFGILLKFIYKNYTVVSDYKKMKPDYVAKNTNTHRHEAKFHQGNPL